MLYLFTRILPSSQTLSSYYCITKESDDADYLYILIDTTTNIELPPILKEVRQDVLHTRGGDYKMRQFITWFLVIYTNVLYSRLCLADNNVDIPKIHCDPGYGKEKSNYSLL